MMIGTLTGCAVMHSVQLGEIDSNIVLEGKRFEINVSQLGLDVEQAASIAEAVAVVAASPETGEAIGLAQDIGALFQWGPKTGAPVFRDDYSDGIIDLIRLECPSGQISGLRSVRESVDYSVIAGEVVKIVGYCGKD
ncbi:MAG: hypothetical protein ACPGTU_02230 [Myxococcota bacterium]